MTYRPVAQNRGVEHMSFDRLRELNDGGTQRADFDVVAVVERGSGSVLVDFTSYPLVRRSVVWISAGAVHRWTEMAGVRGDIVLFVPTAPVTPATRELAAAPDLSNVWIVAKETWPLVTAAMVHLRAEAAGSMAESESEIPAILLSALLERVRPPRHTELAGNDLMLQFRNLVELEFREHHDAGYYANALGYAPRTLSRAVRQSTGQTAKAYVNERIVLEAKRLLSHDRFTAARCADELGFRDASRFSAFFRNATGRPPGAWQASEVEY